MFYNVYTLNIFMKNILFMSVFGRIKISRLPQNGLKIYSDN